MELITKETAVKKEWLTPSIEEINQDIIKADGTFADDPNFDLRTGSNGPI